MQETAQIILQESFDPCKTICSTSIRRTFKRFKVCHDSQENCQLNINSLTVGLAEVDLPTTTKIPFHARKTKPANVMKFKNIFGMSSASSTTSSNSKTATTQQSNMRKGKKNIIQWGH
jgi:uncharacterized protein YegL